MDINNITSIKSPTSAEKSLTHSFNTVFFFFILLAKKFPEIFPKHKEFFFISETFALNLFIFVANKKLTNKKLLLPL